MAVALALDTSTLLTSKTLTNIRINYKKLQKQSDGLSLLQFCSVISQMVEAGGASNGMKRNLQRPA